MISAAEATAIVLEHKINPEIVSCPIDQAIDRILAEDLVADRDFPPYNRVAMDGIAIHYSAFEAGQRDFPIEAVCAAGDPQKELKNTDNCVEIMTGAVLAAGADTVIRYEDVVIKDGKASIQVDNVTQGQNIHTKGLDRKAGSLVVPKGTKISAAEIGVAATVGKPILQVLALPKVIIVSSGDELVDVSEQPKAHQIRRSNVYRLQASLKQWGIAADTAHLIDDEDHMTQELGKMLDTYDVILISGGVSKGKFDFIPAALERLGVEKLFHKIKQRPGKPFWFGKSQNGVRIFALPGNPVSSFMCTQRYFKPWLRASLGLSPFQEIKGQLAEDVHFKPDLTYFMQASGTFSESGQLQLHPVHGHGSGDLANLVDAGVFVELPAGRDVYPAGEVFRVIPFRDWL